MNEFTWMISYLEKNEKPTSSLGQELETIESTKADLKDKDIHKLAQALEKNSVFRGGINLAGNLITDRGVLYLINALKISQCQITSLNLSFNYLNEKSGIYLGEWLASGYKLKELRLRQCDLDEIGIQRIFEAIVDNKSLKALEIGPVHNNGLEVITKYMPRLTKLKEFVFQEGNHWAEASKKKFLLALRENYSLLNVVLFNAENGDFFDEICGIVDRNKILDAQKKAEKSQAESLDPKNFAAEIEGFIENSIQNLPVRVYLANSLGTLLNDGIYQLMKFRFRENDPSKNTAVNNIKWLVRYILDKSRN